MRLARTERERLWKGLERFANCGDTLGDYQALGRGYPNFWPAQIDNWDEALIKYGPHWDHNLDRYLSEEEAVDPPKGHHLESIADVPRLDWNLAFHKWFLFYRDILRAVWSREDQPNDLWEGCSEEFLLNLIDYNEQAIACIRAVEADYPEGDYLPRGTLELIWSEILKQFPEAQAAPLNHITVNWERGTLEYTASNDFARALYLLCRESWRARVCPRCKMLFIARKPKQGFCGTACSAGSRLASKRKWWRSVGTKNRRRAAQLRNRRRKVKGTNR